MQRENNTSQVLN